jgi:hypothetical protein
MATGKVCLSEMDDFDINGEKPTPKIPDNLDQMTPRQAWNAAFDAIDPLISWSLFWDDGRSIEYDHLKVPVD